MSREPAPSGLGSYKPVIAAAAIFGIVGYAVVGALTFSASARVLPLVVGIPVLLMSGLQVVREIRALPRFGRPPTDGADADAEPSDAQQSDPGEPMGLPEDAGSADRLEGSGFAWVAGASALVLLFGLMVGLTVFVVAFLRIHGRESWKMVAAVTLPLMVGLFLAFSQLLNIRLFEGYVLRLLLP